jgi:hypothetical protein
MGKKIFFDDEKDPPDGSWISIKEEKNLLIFIELYGNDIDLISFNYKGINILKWILIKVYDGVFSEVPKLDHHVKNPIQAKNLQNLILKINNLIKIRREI